MDLAVAEKVYCRWALWLWVLASVRSKEELTVESVSLQHGGTVTFHTTSLSSHGPHPAPSGLSSDSFSLCSRLTHDLYARLVSWFPP